MSQLKVEVVAIEAIETHPNADRLELAKVLDWRIVVQKGTYKAGDLAVFFPVDSVLPCDIEATLFPADSKIRLNKSRIRTIKIRGAVSQGMLVNPATLKLGNVKLGTDLTAKLKVEKYEPPTEKSPQASGGGKSTWRQTNPNFRKYTSIENGKNYPTLFAEGEQVSITEKLHGTNFRAGYVPFFADTWWKKIKKFFGFAPKFEFVFGSHNVQLQSRLLYKGYYSTNIYAEAVMKYDLHKKLGYGWVVYGEIVGEGVQKNYHYDCLSGERRLVLFDIAYNGVYVNADIFRDAVTALGLEVVPELYNGPFNLDAAKALTKGNSVYAPGQKVREGVVVKPIVEQQTYMGRKVLKLISEDYLLKDNGDEWH